MTNKMVMYHIEKQCKKDKTPIPKTKLGKRLARKIFREEVRRIRMQNNRGKGAAYGMQSLNPF